MRKLARFAVSWYNVWVAVSGRILRRVLKRLNAHRATAEERRLAREVQRLEAYATKLLADIEAMRTERDVTHARHCKETEILENQLTAAKEAAELSAKWIERYRSRMKADIAVFNRTEATGKRP